MTRLKSLPDDAVLMDVFRAYPATSEPLLDYHETVMRGESPFTVAEREFIAAYVSGLNSCSYCHGVHTVAAEVCGVPVGQVPAAVLDLDAAEVPDKLKPVLRYVAKLTQAPSSVSDGDAQAVLQAGWTEQALHDAVLVCALFNFMNRLVEGLGIRADGAYFAESGKRLHDIGYAGLKGVL